MATRSGHSRYIIKSLVHASAVLSAFRSEGEVLRLRDVVARTGFHKGMCFRLLYTLHTCGFLEKVGENQYRAVSERGSSGWRSIFWRVSRRRRRHHLITPENVDHYYPNDVLMGLGVPAR